MVLETLEEARADSLGRFTLRTTHVGLATLVARAVASRPTAFDVTLPIDSLLTFVLTAQPPILAAIAVASAGEFTLGTGATASLTPLEIVQTPGAAANIARALQTLPGTQAVDEGTGLFVRGGDVTETRVLVDDAWLISPARFDNPTGHVTTTLNPFLLERTTFSAGAFGARYGNALSGLVRMETANPVRRSTAALSASIGSASASMALAPRRGVAVRASAGLSSLSPLVAVFGEAQPYAPPPRGGDMSVSAERATSAGGRVRLFAMQQQSTFGVGEAAEQGAALYANRSTDRFALLSWRDTLTAWRPSATIAYSRAARVEQFGDFAVSTTLVAPQIVLGVHHQWSAATSWSVGAEYEGLHASYRGDRLVGTSDVRPTFAQRTPARRVGLAADVTHYGGPVRVMVGVRRDASVLTARATIDPRVSLAWKVGAFGLTAAWGVYHQIAEPTFRRVVREQFLAMRAEQSVAGAQLGSDSSGLRVEAFHKRYRNLWQFTSGFAPVGGGVGVARGVDGQLRWRFGGTSSTRLSYSYVHSTRTEPNSERLAPALADVRHAIVWVTSRQFRALTVSSAFRFATGRPFTDVIGVDTLVAEVMPIRGEPFGARLPSYRRSDLSASWYRAIGNERGMVLWGSMSNLFGHENIMRYRWSDRYDQRIPVRAPFNRSVFAGATLLF
jgi:hypothetical protein